MLLLVGFMGGHYIYGRDLWPGLQITSRRDWDIQWKVCRVMMNDFEGVVGAWLWLSGVSLLARREGGGGGNGGIIGAKGRVCLV